MTKKLYLLDAFALIYRAHFAFIRNPRINSKGMNTSAILGFANSLIDIINNQQPTHIAVVFDSPGDGIREEIYAEYKANREEMPEDIRRSLPYIKRLIEALNIPIISLPGYEADDLIGTLAKMAESKGYITYMMTPDKDFSQLVSENIFIYKPARSGNPPEILGPKQICKKFEITKPEQVIDILGLWGDAIDNIPGVPGIGEKTAKKLIGKYGSIEGLLKNTHELKGKQKENVENFAEQALLSKQLATIITDSPIEFDDELFEKKEPNKNAANVLLTELEFTRLTKRLLGEETELKAIPKSGQMSLFGQIEKTDESVVEAFSTIEKTKHNYKLIVEFSQHEKLIKSLLKQKKVCFDTETSGLNVNKDILIGLAFSYKKGEAFYCVIPEDPDKRDSVLALYRIFFENSSILKIAHNLKFDASILKKYSISVAGPFFDTMIAHYLLHPEQRHGMDNLAKTFLNYKPITIESLIGNKGKHQQSMKDLPADAIKDYAAEDADITFQLYHVLAKNINSQDLNNLLYDIEIPLSLLLMDMEREGIKLDVKALNEFSKTLNISISELKTNILDTAGLEFNIDSPKQLGNVLFEVLKLDDKAKKTKTGQYKTDEQTLQNLSNKHSIVNDLIDYRQQKKLQSTYVDALPKLIDPVTNRIHTTYMQTVTATGRLSSNNPNLQNIPIRTALGKEIRKSFISRGEDYILLSADYSQIELRIIASLSGDKSMIDAFHHDFDIHSATASKVFNVDFNAVSKEMRNKAKMVNFGIIYGITAFGLSQRLNIKRVEAKEIIDSYFDKYPGIKTYIDDMISFAHQNEFVETIKKRRRYLKDINSKNATLRAFAERNAVNAPIQGSAADIIKIAMINIHKELSAKNLKSKLLLQVHDELVFDMHLEETSVLETLVNDNMVNAVKLKVPLKIELGIAKNWLDAH